MQISMQGVATMDLFMNVLNTIRMTIGVVLFAGVGLNFFYQGIRAFKKLRKSNYSENKIHRFKCRECQESYEINGEDLKSRTSFWSPKLEVRTPWSLSEAIRFECYCCGR